MTPPVFPPASDLIHQRVEAALEQQFRCELLSPSTGKLMSPDERRKTLTALFAEIARGVGVERFSETPVEYLDQFSVISVVKNHDTGGMLISLVKSFMIAYCCPETADRAFSALIDLEALRVEVAEAHGQFSQDAALNTAAAALDNELCRRFPPETAGQPRYRILVGLDRLFVLASEPIEDLPRDIDGVPVEYRAGPRPVSSH